MMKRTIDLIGSSILIVLLAPVLLTIGVAVIVFLGRPVLFRQVRPGLRGKPFTLLKFRTMKDAVDRNGVPLPDEERMTGLGRFLRSTSLDELPELFNVLQGEMSFVGPRPLLMDYLKYYTAEEQRRHDVRPGITGWAQVNGRNRIDWDRRFRLDVWYVDNQSYWLDLKILAMTFWKVFLREDIAAEGHVTMPAFDGRPAAKMESPSETKKPSTQTDLHAVANTPHLNK
ncbi:putative sugar transferase EpsL [Novipirellula aureliae]|uniref:Putative sugar transferase EpsL n=1 Tax=Novipirellula aureliae TaxID=2527966 RepID=A0A5C6DXD5_9BACT|nr:sugar transferase [Novipirellula aureliae]TWU41292.1 putative sugar transferase EpsL [Novipirellula aureliae]